VAVDFEKELLLLLGQGLVLDGGVEVRLEGGFGGSFWGCTITDGIWADFLLLTCRLMHHLSGY